MMLIDRTNNLRELTEIYSAADVFINTTLEDNFPTVNLEALACGTPVVAFDTGGCKETIKNGCGVVVEKGNIQELLEKVKYFSENNKIDEDCIKAARNFDKKDKYREYIKVFETLIEE